MLKLKLQYFGHLDAKSQLIGKDPDGGKDWGQEKKWVTEDEMKFAIGKPRVLQSMRSQRVGHDLATEQQI